MASTSFLPLSDQCFSEVIETLAQLYSGNIEDSGVDFGGSSLLPDLTELECISSLDTEISHGSVREERNYVYSPSVEIQSCYCPRPTDASNCTWNTPDEAITAGTGPILTGRLDSEETEPQSVSSGTNSDLRLESTCSLTPRSTPSTDYGESSLQIRQYSPLKERTRAFEKGQPGGRKDSQPNPKWTATRQDVLKTDKKPKFSIKKDRNGKVQGAFGVFGRSQNIRSALSPNLKKMTALTRQNGACHKCRRSKIRCILPEDPYSPCDKCLKDSNFPQQQPCIRIEILNLKLYRNGSTINNNLEMWITSKEQLHSKELFQQGRGFRHPKTIFLTQDIGAKLQITVSLFTQEAGDSTGYNWRDLNGKRQVMQMPPYYISNICEAVVNLDEYCQHALPLYIDSLLENANPIIRQTFETANSSTLVTSALNLWGATRLTEIPWRICGENKLGVKAPTQLGNPWNGMVPVTPIMDTQLDELVIKCQLNPHKKSFLEEFEKLIMQKKRENWFEIYLGMFVVLCNVEWILKDVKDYTKRHSMTHSSRGGVSLSQGYIHACKTMLSYFHFACNGSKPFHICRPHLSNFDGMAMTKDQAEYISTIKKELTSQEDGLKRWKDYTMYGTEMYWCCQMIDPNWSGNIAHVGPIDDFTEEDFLTS